MPLGSRDAVIRSRRVWLGALVFLVVAGTTAAVVVWLAGGTTERATAEGECHLAGWVSGQGTITGTGAVPCDEPVTLTATAKAGWCFSFWPGDEPSLGCPRSSSKVVTVTAAEGSILWSAVFKLGPPFFIELSAPPICDVEESQGWFGGSASWYTVEEVAVDWSITGGKAPYTITIDGETRDGDGAYEGASGTAKVSCALETHGTVQYNEFGDQWGRTYTTEPTVDSDNKLITASVTDADGLTAEAAIEVYTVYNIGEFPSEKPLLAGETYRILGHLVTAPAGIDIEVGHLVYTECEGTGQGLARCTDAATLLARQAGYVGVFWIGLDDGTEVGQRRIWRENSGVDSAGTQSPHSQEADPRHNLETALDELATKLGLLPEPPSLEAD